MLGKGISNTIVSPDMALVTLSLRDPGPTSFVFVTVTVAACVWIDVIRNINTTTRDKETTEKRLVIEFKDL